MLQRHPPFDVRPRAFDVEKIFSGYVTGQMNIQNPPPNAPAGVPRFQANDAKRMLLGSNNLTQLSLDFSDGLPHGQTWAAVLDRPANLMDQLDMLVPSGFPGFKSVILQIARPFAGDQRQVAKMIADLLPTRPAGNVDASSYTIAIDDGMVIKNFEISQFKYYEFNGVMPPGGMLDIDLEFMVPSDEGLQIKVEARSRDRTAPLNKSSFRTLLQSACQMLDDELVVNLRKAV